MASTQFEIWLEKVNEQRKTYWEAKFGHRPYQPLRVDKGNKYIRLWDGSTCWAFVSMIEGELKGAPIKKGDLLKPASWKSPAKNSRGNIFEGTDKWQYFGPTYLK